MFQRISEMLSGCPGRSALLDDMDWSVLPGPDLPAQTSRASAFSAVPALQPLDDTPQSFEALNRPVLQPAHPQSLIEANLRQQAQRLAARRQEDDLGVGLAQAQRPLSELEEIGLAQAHHRSQVAHRPIIDDREINSPREFQRAAHIWRSRRSLGAWPQQLDRHEAFTQRNACNHASIWQAYHHQEGAHQPWSAFAHEEGAQAFDAFFLKLTTTEFSQTPMFRQASVEWLACLAHNPKLRAETFLISQEASETCEDRATLFFNSMKKARVAADVEAGRYDDRLPELIGLGRRMFRLDQLEVIARERVKSLLTGGHNNFDEIEIYLAYQVKLNRPLDLGLESSGMRYFAHSGLTPNDLEQAKNEVLRAEDQNFIHYLSTDWQPWQAVLQRLNPEPVLAAKEALFAYLENDFEADIQARLSQSGLHESSDEATHSMGRDLMRSKTLEINAQMTQQFLQRHDLAHLLPRQPDEAPRVTSLRWAVNFRNWLML